LYEILSNEMFGLFFYTYAGTQGWINEIRVHLLKVLVLKLINKINKM